MAVEATTLDLRGEPCGVPLLRLERALAEASKNGEAPVRVRGEGGTLREDVELFAERSGWQVVSSAGSDEDWTVQFAPVETATTPANRPR